jgi:hypothetical protein
MFRITRIRKIVPIVFAVVAATMALSSAAQARPGVYTTLTITPAGQYGYQKVEVKGYAAMSRAEAQQIVGEKYTQMSWNIMGADPIFDDYLDGPNLGEVRASARGLEFSGTRVLSTNKLNEDWGEDEVFATLRVYTTKGTKVGTSNRISREFG